MVRKVESRAKVIAEWILAEVNGTGPHKLHFSRKPRKGKHAHQGGGPVRRLGGFFLFGLSETSGEAMRIGRKPLGIVYLTRSGTRNGNKVF